MAIKGLKTTYKIDSTKVGYLTMIGGVEMTKDAVETTTLDDDFRTYRSGLKDGGEVTLEGYFAQNDEGQVALKSAFDNDQDDLQHEIEFPNGTKWRFMGVVTNYKIGDADLDNNIAFAATIKVSGQPELILSDQV